MNLSRLRSFNRFIYKEPVERSQLAGLRESTIAVSTIDDVVTHCRGNQSMAARILGMTRTTLAYMLKDRRPNVVLINEVEPGIFTYTVLS